MAMRVLLGTDGSPDAVRAADWLAGFPLPADSQILVVSVLPHLGSRAAEHKNAMHAQTRQVLEDARLTLAPRAVDVQLTEGGVRERLLETAEEWNADLIVLGARGLSGMERALLGSVSLSVAREASCAVMIVKGAAKPLQRVVVGLDGSEHSRHALNFMASLPLTADTELVLVGVAEKTHLPRSAPRLVTAQLRAFIAEVDEEEKTRKQQILADAEHTINLRGRVQLRSVVGNPPDEIVAVAKTTGAQLIVLGSRGLGRLQRLVLGSVSEGVLLQSECTVIITKRSG
jgi:nucleotide-binding universal stress UspA family protein